MDDKDLVKAGAEGLMKPISDLVDKIAGPAAEEIGLTLRDSVRVYRAKRQLRLLRKLQAMVEEAGISPHSIPLKVLLPALDYASVEDDEQLHTAWAALLANAADPESGIHISGSFPEMLRVLSPPEAQLLDAITTRSEHRASFARVKSIPLTALQLAEKDLGTWDALFDIQRGLGHTRLPRGTLLPEAAPNSEKNKNLADRSDFQVALDHLHQLGLITITQRIEAPGEIGNTTDAYMDSENHYYLTALGVEFVRACRIPRARSCGSE